MMRKTIVAALLAATAVMGGSGLRPPAAHAITGGQPVTNGDLGFVALVANTTAGGTCTGSLIHPSWVLTAVHCSVPTSVGDMTVRVGAYQGNAGEPRRVTRIIRHPDYQGGYNDVALLELSSPVTTVKPVQLATPFQSYLWDGIGGGFSQYDYGIAAGWGKLSPTSGPAGTLQFAGVTVTPPTLDSAGLKQLNVTRGPCEGDSGGPLLVSVDGAYVQAGVLKAATCGGTASYSEVGNGANRGWIMDQLTKLPYTTFGLADYDRDGHQDIIVRHDATGDLWLYPGQSVRGYSTIQRSKIGNGWRGYTAFGVADWDRDGHQDIITRQDTTGELWMYPGESVRGYSRYQRVKIGDSRNGWTPFGIADWDRDGNQDMILRDDWNGELWLYPGQGVRGYSTASRVWLGSGFNRFSSFDVTDWDRDGNQDLIARNNDSGILWLYLGDGRRAAMSGERAIIGYGWAGYTSFGAADYDRDGHQDIVARQDRTTELWLYRGQSMRAMSTIPRVQIGNGL